jgi:hypothetical protein
MADDLVNGTASTVNDVEMKEEVSPEVSRACAAADDQKLQG